MTLRTCNGLILKQKKDEDFKGDGNSYDVFFFYLKNTIQSKQLNTVSLKVLYYFDYLYLVKKLNN